MNKTFKRSVHRIKEALSRLQRERISLRFSTLTNEALAIGASKYGGQPDVPDGFEWPTDNDSHPLSLMLQINCVDIAAMDKEGALPKSGILYFFYQVSEQPWDNTTNGARVLYFDTSVTELHRHDYPTNLAKKGIIAERALQFQIDMSYPLWSL